MRTVRTTATLFLMATAFFATASSNANSANPVGNGNCDTPPGSSGDFCTWKNDDSGPIADWTGDNLIAVFNDWRYTGHPTDSPNDDGERATNGDFDTQVLYEDPNFDVPYSCFEFPYNNTDMRGRENNDSSLRQDFGVC